MKMHIVPLSAIRFRPAEADMHGWPKEAIQEAFRVWLYANFNSKMLF